MSNLSDNAPGPVRRIGLATATLLVVANMIGVGVFTAAGFMIGAIGNAPAVLFAWLVGGIAAYCGALAYAELGAALPHNGGEYQLLTRIYHPIVGFVAGWVSLVVGFAAPLALYAMAFGEYLQTFVPAAQPLVSGLILIAVFTVLHAVHIEAGGMFQNAFTLGKIALIVGFIALGWRHCDWSYVTGESVRPFGDAVLAPAFPAQLVYVAFAYNGWNAVQYLAGEVRRPERFVPWAVLGGTVLVALLYLGLNAVFLAAAPAAELAQAEGRVAYVAAVNLFGTEGGKFISVMIALGLVSTVSATIMTGPRGVEVMSGDYPALRFLSGRGSKGGPVFAILLQSCLAAVMMLSSTLRNLMNYVGLTLSVCTALTVFGVIILRRREPTLERPYRVWGYPVTPIVCVVLQGWMIVSAMIDNPWVALWGIGTIGVGLAIYGVVIFAGSPRRA